jgi:asparagine synthase (glutamine-hydrolysing)
MCGIAGIVRLDGKTVDTAAFMEALTTMRHRGPDDEGSVLLETSNGKYEAREGSTRQRSCILPTCVHHAR